MAKFFKKETTRPLTKYQKQIKDEAGMLALSNPTLLCRRGELLEKAREKVVEKGYTFVKGKSRSKRFASPDESPRPTRVKISTDVREKRISALEEDIANLDQQLLFKEKRRQQSENVRNYKFCDEITEEIGIVRQQKRKISEELRIFREKQRKAKWYQNAKRGNRRVSRSSSTTSNVTSDDSDAVITSPSSSLPRPSGESVEVGSGSDDEHDSVFQLGLPADRQ